MLIPMRSKLLNQIGTPLLPLGMVTLRATVAMVSFSIGYPQAIFVAVPFLTFLSM